MAGPNGTSGSGGNGTAGGNGHARPPAGDVPPSPPGPDDDADGQIPDLDKSIRQAFFKVLAETNDVTVACDVVGFHKSTFYRWIKKGEAATEGKYFSFARMVVRARAEWERRQVAAIEAAGADYEAEEDWAEQWTKGEGKDAETRSKVVKKRRKKKGDWRARAFLLERKMPEKYGPKQKVEVEGNLSIVDVLTALRDEQEKDRDDRLGTLSTGQGPDRVTSGEG